jgi:hypothetical protein
MITGLPTFSADEAAQLAGVTLKAVNQLIRADLVIPAVPSRPGKQARLSAQQTLALAAVAAEHAVAGGVPAERVAYLVDLCDLPDAELAAWAASWGADEGGPALTPHQEEEAARLRRWPIEPGQEEFRRELQRRVARVLAAVRGTMPK